MNDSTDSPTAASGVAAAAGVAAPVAQAALDVKVSGMTCTSCSARVQRKLKKLPGVDAAVNFATETAHVVYDPATVSEEQLLQTVRDAGYGADPATTGGVDPAAGDDRAQVSSLVRRLVVAAVLGVPVMVLSMVPAAQFDYWQWLCLALTVPVYVYGGWPFHRAAVVNLRHGAFTMDTLISLGTTAALAWSLVALTIGHAGHPGMRMEMALTARPAHGGLGEIYLDSVAMIIVFLLVGRLLEERAKRRSASALEELLKVQATEVLLPDGRTIDAQLLLPGMEFLVTPGTTIATDGEVVAGASEVDEQMLSGESLPVHKTVGDEVTGGTVNTTGSLTVRATRVGRDTVLAQMGELVAQAQLGKAPVQRLVDSISQVFVPVILGIALLTLVGQWATGHDAAASFAAAVAVIVVACPCALGLATPTALLVGTGRGAQLGLLIKGAEVLESTRRADVVVLDKTGTVTTGTMSVEAHSDDASLLLAGAVERHSEHPLARAIVTAAQDLAGAAGAGADPAAAPGGVLADASDIVATPGEGISGTIDGARITVGRPHHDEALAAQHAHPEATTVEITREGNYLGWVAVADTIKDTSAEGVQQLVDLGLEPYLLTGDHQDAADAVARAVGISHVTAGVRPEDKVAVVKKLQDEGHVVAMVGDGMNDAAALAQADLGLAMASGTDVAMAASDITLMRNDLRAAATAIRLSRSTLRTIKGNLVWAFGYNVALVPIAALGFLNPMWAGLAMACSSVFVVTNSLRLRRFQPTTG
ncbi:heavy metal translocating P-type ATPase [Corynebacterium sp. 13CS0277]|uniref:heavy metal translocating P-type ATPase n=1 Tax=Corynebacterium sp. 13CS0277 TaxID=2071994 RepID=UPI000D045018|nr:heavy metal translocating P-type ATPase [Corynebacterium sp. 13CS0277]PRQ11056.1 heavy metal translocating P-type ATPase [Corynebacterium sp. 13CS0277]